MGDKVFNKYSDYYDILYQDKQYGKEAEYVFNILKTYLPEAKTVIELGMGTGIHASLLVSMGLDVEGIELSEQMALTSEKKGLVCTVANCIDFFLNKKFDSAISLFHVISYLTSNDDLIKTLNNIGQHLKPGGLFVFDVWYTPAVYSLKPEVRVKRFTNEKIKVTRIAEPNIHYNQNVVDVNYDIFIENLQTSETDNFQEKHPMRHFSLPELQILADTTGYKVLKTEEWLTKDSPSEKTWGIISVWEKY